MALTPDQEKLKEAALAATQGKWTRAAGYAVVCEAPNVRHHNDYAVLDGSKFLQIATTIHGSLPGRDAEFIAIANPTAILAILAQLEQVQGDADRNAALEDAALACEAQLADGECPERAQYCADAIRALKSAPPPPEAA